MLRYSQPRVSVVLMVDILMVVVWLHFEIISFYFLAKRVFD